MQKDLISQWVVDYRLLSLAERFVALGAEITAVFAFSQTKVQRLVFGLPNRRSANSRVTPLMKRRRPASDAEIDAAPDAETTNDDRSESLPKAVVR